MPVVGEMSRFNVLLCLLVALSVLSMVSANTSILAAVITCAPYPPICYGTINDDIINGSDQFEWMDGLGGNDKIYGNGDHDAISGSDGNDAIFGGVGDDGALDGGAGNDALHGGAGPDEIIGGEGDDQIYGDDDHDISFGGPGKDIIRAGLGNDFSIGGQGNDILYGSEGNDILIGDLQWGDLSGYGADIIKGGPGDDKLFQGQYIESPGEPLKSDGIKDTLNCGDGYDEAWVNVSTDHDEAPYCEVVHKG
jgi:Ca2+-binding RTX toxin-like protein